ncbi:HAD-IA family hydrolase [Luteolibacter marinus]|uniref:HAD-IA family hydrolase n=1 Tax=Luteolibacter marinus TaxID=2776705 RepID=UPI00186676F1
MKSRKVIGVRYPAWSSFGAATMRGVVDFMRANELWRLVTENDSYGEMEAVKIDGDWHGDGVILFRATEDELRAFRKRGTAVVLTSTEGPDLGYPRVIPDNRMIGGIAARHLVERSLPDFAFLARGETFYREARFASGLRVYARERLRGFRAELNRYAIEPRVHYLKGRPLWEDHTWREVQTEVAAFLGSLPEPCGLFAVDDALAAVVLRAADMLGRKVPDQLAVIGYGDDQDYCYSTFPALSSIGHPAREIGFKAAELLKLQMDGGDAGGESRLVEPGGAVARESSDVLAIRDPEVRELVTWIRRTAPHDPIRVSELAERSSLSLTTIKERFARALGHSPKQEIKLARLAHLVRLLENPALTLADIAEQMKFASAHELSRFFTGATGSRPTEFRNRPEGREDGLLPQPGQGAVIFDMDGTLFDSESLYCTAFQAAYREQGGELRREQYFEEHAGTTNDAIEQRLAARAPAGFDVMTFNRRWREHLDELVAAEGALVPFPGVAELLGRLADSGIPLALASSSEVADIDRFLAAAGLAGYFHHRAGGDEVSRGKPDPEVFLLAARRAGADPARCVAIEDSRAGVTAAHRAGMRVIHVHRGFPVDDAVAGLVSRSVGEFRELRLDDLTALLGP